MKTLIFIILCVMVALAVPAKAAQQEGLFWIGLEGDFENWNEINESLSGGNGYTASGPWYEYPHDGEGGDQTDPWGGVNPVPSWVNQWWYDDPPDPDKWKEVTVTFNYQLIDPLNNGGADIAINYSTLEYPESGPDEPDTFPKTNADPEDPSIIWVGRVDAGSAWIPANDNNTYNYSQTFDLRDYNIDFNPEWISVDVAGYNVQISSNAVPGSILHECLPEPTTIALLGLGGLLLRRRKR